MCSDFGEETVLHPGAHFSVKMLSSQYRNSHYKDKRISQLSYLYNGNPHTWNDGPYIEMASQSSIPFAQIPQSVDQ